MSVYSGPPFIVDGPRPVAPLYRLLDVANIIDEPDPHWMNGAQVWGYPPDLPLSWDICSTGTNRPKEEGGTIPIPDFGAFGVYFAETCTARSVRNQEEFVGRALAAFAASESYAVEREFSQGIALPANPYLSDANADVLAGGAAQTPKVGLARLADALGATGRNGVIHMTPATVVSLGFFRSYRDASRLYTVEGTPISEGDGYIGAVPVGQGALADGHAWAFATGPVDIRRSQPIVYPGNISQALDRAENTITYRVERTYLVDWDTVLQAAVLIDWTSVVT